MEYRPHGVCSQKITFDIQDNTVHAVQFTGGCSGNLQGIAKLIEGMNVDEAISRIEGIKCGFKSTSCPDQLAQALKRSNRTLRLENYWQYILSIVFILLDRVVLFQLHRNDIA